MKLQLMSQILCVVPHKLLVPTFALILAVAAGCSSSSGRGTNINNPRTDGERVLFEARSMEAKGEMMVKAERLTAGGQGKRTEGDTLKSQGKTVTGERISAEGDTMVREGEALMERARSMNTKATQPSRQ